MKIDPSKPLRLYVNPKWRRHGVHTPLLNPWWGNPYDKSSIFSRQMFDSYSFDIKSYGITNSIKEAEMIFPPYSHSWLLRYDKKLLTECVQIAQESNLPLLIDGTGDIEHPIGIKNTYVLRYGGYRFLSDSKIIQIPLFVDDLLERCRKGQLVVRKKTENNPVIGFAGWVNLSPKHYLKTIIKELPARLHSIIDDRYEVYTKGVLWRQKAIGTLRQSSQVTLNLRLRNSFSANPKTAEGDMKKLREEMVDTILQSDYSLDVRGDANNSARLFEILSLGRIPVIIDTERNFPFSEKINYSSFSLIIDFRDLKYLPERIAEFHKNISPDSFEQMQKNARDVFVNYFRIDAIMKSVVETLRTKMQK